MFKIYYIKATLGAPTVCLSPVQVWRLLLYSLYIWVKIGFMVVVGGGGGRTAAVGCHLHNRQTSAVNHNFSLQIIKTSPK